MNGLPRSLAVVSTMVLASCAHVTPPASTLPPLPSTFSRAQTAADETMVDHTVFWSRFDDPLLARLIDEATRGGFDLREAVARYESGVAIAREASLGAWPVVTARAEAGQRKVSADQAYGYPRNNGSYLAGIDARWEVDLFGRVRHTIASERAMAAAAGADVHGTRIAIAGQVAATYFDLRGSQEQRRIAAEQLDNQRRVRDIVSARFDAGRGTTFDTARTEAQLATTSALLPALDARIAMDEHRLGVLTGHLPEALIDELDAVRALPMPPGDIAVGTPATVLKRRPDVAAAEDRLQASLAAVGVAKADLFPRVTLLGMLGTQAYHTDDVFHARSETRAALLGIDWSFLDVGRVRARIRAREAEVRGSMAAYERAVGQALEDVEDRLLVYRKTREEYAELDRASRSSDAAVELARIRYRAGSIDLFEVLDAERVALDVRLRATDGRMRVGIASVSLYLALAGGWADDPVERVEITDATIRSGG